MKDRKPIKRLVINNTVVLFLEKTVSSKHLFPEIWSSIYWCTQPTFLTSFIYRYWTLFNLLLLLLKGLITVSVVSITNK